MKKSLLPLLFLFIIKSSIAQEFIFQLNFTDAVGNKDSLLLGYDVNATDSVDASFGEVNIISTPLDTTFDVRVRVSGLFDNPTSSTVQLKKQIVKQNNACQNNWTAFNPIIIDIFSKHWPITAIWNNMLFNDTCREGSVFTSIHPGGWWDVGSPSSLYRAELALVDSVTFTPNANPSNINNIDAYLNANSDTISVFWLKFGDSTLLTTTVNQHLLANKISVYPNPVSDVLHVSISKDIDLTNAKISLTDVSGKQVLGQQLNTTDTKISVNHLSSGIYLLKVQYIDEIVIRKIVIDN